MWKCFPGKNALKLSSVLKCFYSLYTLSNWKNSARWRLDCFLIFLWLKISLNLYIGISQSLENISLWKFFLIIFHLIMTFSHFPSNFKVTLGLNSFATNIFKNPKTKQNQNQNNKTVITLLQFWLFFWFLSPILYVIPVQRYTTCFYFFFLIWQII